MTTCPIKNSAMHKLLSLLNIEFPLIQAPMAGGLTTPSLVSTVSNNGCLGSIAGGYLSPEQLDYQIVTAKKLTSRPISVNLFISEMPEINKHKIKSMQNKLNIFRERLGLPMQTAFHLPEYALHQQMDVILSHSLPIVSFTFGVLDTRYIQALKANKTIIIGTATNLLEAKILEKNGCDAIIAQGFEAGGHRGTFVGDYRLSLMGILPLVQQLTAHTSIPIIAAGGIMDGRGLLANLNLGAAAVQMGTAFLACAESGTPDIYKDILLKSEGEDTELTRAFTGKLARGISNLLMNELRDENNILGYPLQHSLTSDIRKAAALQQNVDYMSLWAGQGVGLLKEKNLSAKDIIACIKQDSIDAIFAPAL